MALPFVLIMKSRISARLSCCCRRRGDAFPGGPCRTLFWCGSACAVGLLAALFLADVLFAPPGWYQVKLQDYQRRRLLVYFGQEYAPPSGASKAEIDRLRKQHFDDSHNVAAGVDFRRFGRG